MPFTLPHGVSFHSDDEIPVTKLCSALRRVVVFLQGLKFSPQQLRLYLDWWEHDGLHFEKRPLSFDELFRFIETPRTLFEVTPDDDKVFIGVASDDARWYLRFRAEWDANDQLIVGSFAIILPQETVQLFRREVVESLGLPLNDEDSAEYYQRVIVS